MPPLQEHSSIKLIRAWLGARKPELIVLAGYLVTRVAYYYAGIRFQAFPIREYWQFIDVRLMRFDLLRSLWYLHMQPPGFNLIIGLIVKLFPREYPVVCQLLYLGAGIGITLGLMNLMRRFRIPDSLRVILVLLFICNPGVVFYENFVIYEYLVLFLLVVAAILLFRFIETPTLGRSAAFFGSLLALVMLRNQFHLIWLCAITLGLLWLAPRLRRQTLIGAAPCLAIVLALYVKNWILFGQFTSSTWIGMTTAVVTSYHLRPDEADALVASGAVSRLVRIPPFAPMKAYEGLIEMPGRVGIEVLDNAETSDGHPNYNALAYLRLHQLYLHQSWEVLRRYPITYARSFAIAWYAYFLPDSDLHSFDSMRNQVQSFDRWYSMAVFGQFRHASSRKDLRAMRDAGQRFSLVLYTGTFLIGLLPLLFVWGTRRLIARKWRTKRPGAQELTLGFMLFNILFVTLLSNTLSTFENNRYRFPLEGYYICLAGALATGIVQRWRKSSGLAPGWSGSAPNPTQSPSPLLENPSNKLRASART
ncbi:MAG TPA: hypothetical protein VEU96_28150 [Bryobacteraceae bacterium]|nr:hypothetical protein [Bryobacteraceae bacterium]